MRRVSPAGQLALWVGRKGRGSARLRWAGHELVVFVAGMQVVGVQGDDGERLEAGLGLTTATEWYARAAEAVAAGQVTQAEANALVKRALGELLREWMLDPESSVSFDSAPLSEPQGLTISYPHLIVEMVLGPGGDALVPVFIPDPDLVLRRLPDFVRRVGALGLTEEAMAVFAKISDRTAAEIAVPSPHGQGAALRLLAAVVGAGLVEAVPRITETPIEVVEAEPERAVGARSRVWRWALLLIVIAGVIAVAVALARSWGSTGTAGQGGPWGVAIDGGCQSAELERIYRRQSQDPDNLRLAKFLDGDQPCYRLVWGHFPDRLSAERAAAALPSELLARGYVAHAVLPAETQ